MFNLLKTHSILFPPPKNVWHCVPSPLLPPVDPLFCFSQMYLIPLHPSLECSETCHYLTFFFSLWSPIFLLLPFCFLRQSLSSDPPTFTSGLLWQPSCLPCNRFRSLSLSSYQDQCSGPRSIVYYKETIASFSDVILTRGDRNGRCRGHCCGYLSWLMELALSLV